MLLSPRHPRKPRSVCDQKEYYSGQGSFFILPTHLTLLPLISGCSHQVNHTSRVRDKATWMKSKEHHSKRSSTMSPEGPEELLPSAEVHRPVCGDTLVQ